MFGSNREFSAPKRGAPFTLVFIGPAHAESFRGARGAIEKHQNGPEPFGPMKYGVNSAPWFEAENSRFETGDPSWPGFILSNRPTGPPGSTGSSSVPSPPQTHASLTILAVRRRQIPRFEGDRPGRGRQTSRSGALGPRESPKTFRAGATAAPNPRVFYRF